MIGTVSSVEATQSYQPEELDSLPPEEIQNYLGLDADQYSRLDQDQLRRMFEIKASYIDSSTDSPDARINTAAPNMLVAPHQWEGLDEPEFIWEPVSSIRKFNIIPLLTGSLKVTFVALMFAIPISLGAALYVSQFATSKIREWLKPSIELLAGIPSIVLGFFALLVLAPLFQKLLGYEVPLNAFVAGIALGLAIIPLIFSVAEDALMSVPKSYGEAALALGASRWSAASRINLPAAMPGILASMVLGFGRAFGETMIVLLACGNSHMISWNLFDSVRPIPATIAAELAAAVPGQAHFHILFFLGTLLFIITFVSNLIGGMIIQQLKDRLEGQT